MLRTSGGRRRKGDSIWLRLELGKSAYNHHSRQRGYFLTYVFLRSSFTRSQWSADGWFSFAILSTPVGGRTGVLVFKIVSLLENATIGCILSVGEPDTTISSCAISSWSNSSDNSSGESPIFCSGVDDPWNDWTSFSRCWVLRRCVQLCEDMFARDHGMLVWLTMFAS
jgi:hypothetical protein